MTSSETKSSGNATAYTLPKKIGGGGGGGSSSSSSGGSDSVIRKPSFKCSTPNKAASQRISAKKVVLPLSTVQALTFKFNELSQMSEGQKHRISPTAVKNLFTSGGKTSTIKVVICRKPSTARHKRSEDVLLRKKISVKRFHQSGHQTVGQEEKKNSGRLYVHQKITEFEEKERAQGKRDTNFSKSSTGGKTQMSKILVDIDLTGDNGILSDPIETDKSNPDKMKPRNSFSVKTAINLFEKNSKNEEQEWKKTREPGKLSVSETRSKPIAAIKPILKKPDEKGLKKIKLLPKDSLNRKRYVLMKREFLKNNRSQENSDEDVRTTWNKDDSEGDKDSGISTTTDSERKIKNDSSLHKQIQHSGLTIVTTEIPLQEDKTFADKDRTKVLNSSLKPNTSFLWSKKEDLYGEKKQINRLDLPLPIPPENYVPNIKENSNNDSIYDDVLPRTRESDSEEFEKMDDSDDCETYDDVGIYNGTKQKSNGAELDREVRLKNKFNEMSDKSSYLYDDGEGEKYQYISDKTESFHIDSNLELYQYIPDCKDDAGNIYEDIQSIKCQLSKTRTTTVTRTTTTTTTKTKSNANRVKDIYEDVNCTGPPNNNNNHNNDNDDNELLNNCYESVYNGIYTDSNGTQGYIKSDLSDTSNNSGRSTYEKSNSLYGMSGENAAGSDGISSMGDGSDLPENLGYHVTLFGSACPMSETSQSNSDEWVEVSESDSEETIYLVQERPRRSKLAGGGFSQKEKKRWKKLQRKSNYNIDEVRLQNSDDHFYESVGQYENAEIIQEAARILKAEQANNHINREQFYSEDQFIDDFDSQSSGDEAYTDAKLPDIPNHGYNITKSLKAAGKKLRKNFSLRKSDLSKSLKRFKKSSRPKVTETVLGGSKDSGVDSSQKSESPSSPTYVSNSIYSNTSDSSSGSQSLVKGGSATDLKNPRHRKSWTFRSRFKSQSAESGATENNATLDTNRNSTFYLSLNEVKPKEIDKKSDLLSEIQSVVLKRNGTSVENLTEKDVVLRHSDSGSGTGANNATTGTMTKFRPNVPPPPPPPNKTEASSSDKTKYSDILWGEKANNNCLYVESGLFDKQKKHSRCSDSDTSLYAEIGLYAATDELNSKKTQMFVDEPLYQFYTECVNQRARDDILNNYDSEGYEEINDYYSVINEKRRTIDIKNVKPNFEDFNEDVRSSKMTPLRSISDRRTLWCQIPAVVDSCILESMSDQARKLQEAKFEIITSEGSYMNSLNVLENHFMKKVSDLNIITKRDFRILFSNIVSVKKCSESFLEDLENCWQNNIMLTGICDIVYKHSSSSFQVYTKYCKNQVCIYRTLRELLDKNWNFENALKEIESDPICQNLNIHSFLMLPMQRITRLPLLMGAVLARMDKDDDEFEVCKASFDILNKIVQDCDDEARRMEKCEEMLILSQQIEFPKDIRRIPIITGSRFLVKSGQVTQLVNRDENKLTFGKKFSKVTLTLFLFTDLLILAKKKNPRNYVVVDHCPRNLVQMQMTDGLTQLPVKLNSNSDVGGRHLMLLTMLENHEKKTVEMILSFEMESDRQRWLEAVTPKSSENPNECIYEEWDCPQVIALYEFTPVQPDELNLCIGDVVNVLKKMSDGWYQGERLRDGARGWFPQNHTQEVSSSHIRAKNKKLRYKLLALSGNLIDSQKANGK